MIKQPAGERKCLLPLNSIAGAYRHAEERDVVTGTTVSPLICSLRVTQVPYFTNHSMMDVDFLIEHLLIVGSS